MLGKHYIARLDTLYAYIVSIGHHTIMAKVAILCSSKRYLCTPHIIIACERLQWLQQQTSETATTQTNFQQQISERQACGKARDFRVEVSSNISIQTGILGMQTTLTVTTHKYLSIYLFSHIRIFIYLAVESF